MPDVFEAKPNFVQGEYLLIHAEKWLTGVQLKEGQFTD